MPKRNTLYTLCVLILGGLLAGCAQTEGATTEMAERHPFSLSIAGGDGAQISWEGYTDGLRPGATETIRLAATNTSGGRWTGRLCLQLLESQPASVVVPLAEQEIDLESGVGIGRDVSLNLPADLSPGVYGLALVVHKPAGPIVSTIPVQVGDGEQEPFTGEWPTDAALAACPAP